MKWTREITEALDKSVLCWLATASLEGMPNVSPKEVFTHYDELYIIIANIASPQSVKNIQNNPKVCLSFIDPFIQKGYQLKGMAEIIEKEHSNFSKMAVILEKITEGKFPFNSIIKITPTTAKKIWAPSYILYPDTTEEEQMERAKITYGVK